MWLQCNRDRGYLIHSPIVEYDLKPQPTYFDGGENCLERHIDVAHAMAGAPGRGSDTSSSRQVRMSMALSAITDGHARSADACASITNGVSSWRSTVSVRVISPAGRIVAASARATHDRDAGLAGRR
jgi:hypothetical protein